MKDIGMLFSTPMVQALLEGRKTMTRRGNGLKEINTEPDRYQLANFNGDTAIFSFQPITGITKTVLSHCPYAVGDRIWVKETYTLLGWWQGDVKPHEIDGDDLIYKADYPEFQWLGDDGENEQDDGKPFPSKWKSSMFMPKKYARIWLEIVSVGIERLQDISEEDARKEGAMFHDGYGVGHSGWRHDYQDVFVNIRSSFAHLWESIYGIGAWERDKNKFVWKIGFEVKTNG
jgi:hypothetical protein